jgi:hypothetical protein
LNDLITQKVVAQEATARSTTPEALLASVLASTDRYWWNCWLQMAKSQVLRHSMYDVQPANCR